MGYKNSTTYIQKNINQIFNLFKDFAAAYINNNIIFLKNFNQYIQHLKQIFTEFIK